METTTINQLIEKNGIKLTQPEKIKVRLKIEKSPFNESLNSEQELSLNIRQVLPAMNKMFTENSIIIDYNCQERKLRDLKWK